MDAMWFSLLALAVFALLLAVTLAFRSMAHRLTSGVRRSRFDRRAGTR
ncbi:MAG: hypothetical protein IPK24_18905 [Kineosporiaceae bacterium]|nr:hypothetical protein [Kineosporiaceae bacterium]